MKCDRCQQTESTRWFRLGCLEPGSEYPLFGDWTLCGDCQFLLVDWVNIDDTNGKWLSDTS